MIDFDIDKIMNFGFPAVFSILMLRQQEKQNDFYQSVINKSLDELTKAINRLTAYIRKDDENGICTKKNPPRGGK